MRPATVFTEESLMDLAVHLETRENSHNLILVWRRVLADIHMKALAPIFEAGMRDYELIKLVQTVSAAFGSDLQ